MIKKLWNDFREILLKDKYQTTKEEDFPTLQAHLKGGLQPTAPAVFNKLHQLAN